MKKTKKIVALLLALVMTLTMSVATFAATITINGNDGETYTAYKVLDVSTSTDDEGKVTGYSYTTTSSDVATVLETAGATVSKSASGNLWYVTWDAKNADTLTNYLAGLDGDALVALLGAPVKSVKLDGKTGTITDLAPGYYFVTSTLGSLCMLNTAADTATIDDKNEEPTVEKKVDGAATSDAQIGDTVTFTVTINVPANTEKLGLSDTLSNGLSLNNNSFTIAVGDSDAAPLTVIPTNNDDGTTSFTVDLTDYLAELTDGETITVTYTAMINANAISTNPATNEATVNYGNSSSVSSKTTTSTHTLTIIKTDEDGNRLKGAEFQLKDAEGNPVYVVANATDGYRVATSSTESGATTTIVVNGSVTIDGLDAETYTLTETKAPEGYNLLTAAKTIEVTANNTASITVENVAGSQLPTTGGMGTTVIYILGAVLVLGAGIVLVVRRRMSADR